MSKYNVLIADSVIEFLDKLGTNERERIIKRIEKLKENPYSVGEPRGKFWLLKIGRSGYRIAYRVLEGEKAIRITAIEKRKSWKYKDFYR